MAGNDKSYLEALRKLRRLIADEFSDGGWLPSSREMSEKLNVSRNTYAKALKWLEKDGSIRSYPKKGHNVTPEFLRVKKIGVIIGEAEYSPFMANEEMLCVILETMKKANYHAHLLQAADIENLPDTALIHGVQALIWISPPERVCPLLRKIHHESDLPIMTIDVRLDVLGSMNDIVSVLPDSMAGPMMKKDFFEKKKHKKIVYVASKSAQSAFDRFQLALKDSQLEALLVLHDVNGKNANLSILSKDPNITGMIIDGGARDAYDIFYDMSKLKKHFITDLYVHYTIQLETIRKMYPTIKVTAIGDSDTALVGKVAATNLLNHLIKGEALKSRRVNYFSIREL